MNTNKINVYYQHTKQRSYTEGEIFEDNEKYNYTNWLKQIMKVK